LPFFKSLPGKQLIIATALVLVFVFILPWLPFARLLGFSKLPVAFYGWMMLIVAAYIVTAELAKKWFFHRAKNLS
jgi:P-type Mg2+ transporter